MVRSKWVGLVAFAASLWGCTSLLGDFSVGGDASTADAQPDAVTESGGPDVTPDVAKDAPAEAETGPSCGGLNQQCCANNVCNAGACCGGTCQDLSNDAKNCGACGHNCLGTSCNAYMCQAQQLGAVVDKRPGRVRLDGSNAYFITVNGAGNGALYVCSLQGCTTPAVLFSGLGYGYDLALDDNATTAYVADFNASKLYSCALGGCNKTPSLVQVPVSGNVAGLAFRSEIYAVVGAQPHEFKITGQNDVSLGNNNEGANYIATPPGSSFAYWQNTHAVRVGQDNTAMSGTDFWTTTTENVMQVEASAAYVAWVAEGSSATTVYTCAVGNSCTANNVLATGNVGYEAGALTIDAFTKAVYWTGVDQTASHVTVHGCMGSGCNGNPMMLANIATAQGGAVAGGVATDASYVYFTFEDKGTVYLSRVAK